MQSYPIKKSFFQHTKNSISHCTKANEQLQISSAKTYCELAVHLLIFEKISVLRLHYGNPFAPIQILTVDTRKPCNTRHSRLHDERRTFSQQLYIDRRFESRSQDGVVSLKHGRLAHVRSQFSLFRRSPTHKNLPPATFCTSERAFWFFLHDAKRIKSFSLQRTSRFCKPQFSSPQWRLPTNKIKSFCLSAAFAPPCGDFFLVVAATSSAAPRLLSSALPTFLLPAATVRRPAAAIFLLFVKYKK